MTSHKPLGIFWDTNECFIPLQTSAKEWIKHLRNFLKNNFSNCFEYEFNCFCDSKLINESIIQSIEANDCTVLNVDSESETNVFTRMDQMVRKFVDTYGFNSIVVLITNNLRIDSTVRLVRLRDVSVTLISDQKPDQSLSDWIPIEDVFELDKSVILSVTNIPNDKSRKTIRDSFIPFCRQYNCRFRFNRRDSVRLEFNNVMDAQRANTRLNELLYFGHDLNIEVKHIRKQISGTSSPSGSSMNTSSPSVPSSEPKILPQNDDKCKSVIIGLFTKYNQNVYKVVQNIINSWNDPTVSESMVYRVNRERDFIGRDGKASLIVTTINRQSNHKLISMAKKLFVDRKNKLYWNRLMRSPNSSNKNNDSIDESTGEEPNQCMSIITGLRTRNNDNILKTIRNLVKNWNINGFDIRNIVSVQRSKLFNGEDGKVPLIVSTDSSQNTRIIVEYSSLMFERNNHKFHWEPLTVQQLSNLNELFKNKDQPLDRNKETTSSYASIVCKPTMEECADDKENSQSLSEKCDPIVSTRRRRYINSRCHCH